LTGAVQKMKALLLSCTVIDDALEKFFKKDAKKGNFGKQMKF